MQYTTEIKVRYAETDQMGIVHHSRYFPWFEVARTEFLEEYGIQYGELEKQGVMFPLIKAQAEYHQGAKYGDTVLVKVQMKELRIVRCQLIYEVIRKADGALLVTGLTEHAFVDSATFQPINLKKKQPMVWRQLEKALEKESNDAKVK